jgi:hypothetical protein
MSMGMAELWQWLIRVFYTDLWERPGMRKRWALRWRTEAAVHDIARDLGWSAAVNLDRIIPVKDLGPTIRYAVLHELVTGKRERDKDDTPDDFDTWGYYPIFDPVVRMLDWLLRYNPEAAHTVVSEIVGEADRKLSIDREVAIRSLHTALSSVGKLNGDTYAEWLHRTVPPAT